MPIRRDDDTIHLEGVCAVEDAEELLQQLQSGATAIDWTSCQHLHAACLQLMIAVRLPIHGTPANPEIARWLLPLFHPTEIPPARFIDAEPVFELEM